MKVIDLLNAGSKKLKHNGILSHRLDSEIFLSKVLSKKREEIIIDQNDTIKTEKVSEFDNMIARRANNEPVAYIIKEKEFWSKIFEVNKSTLIPRPETELMVEKLIDIYKRKKISILDIGTGTGCILISLLDELQNSSGIGIDISKKALIVANKNAKKHGLKNIKFINVDLSKYFLRKFDLIVSNPPYLDKNTIKNLHDDIKRYEPLIALNGGNDGLDVIKKVIYKSKYILKINGKLALEIGNEQYKKVSTILFKNSFKIEHIIKDYKDNIRCLISKLIGN